MKFEEGMYVRFKDKRNVEYIRQITTIPKDNRYASIYLDREANYSKGLSFKNVLKASHNIIDLIEVGDVLAIKENIDNFKQTFILGIYEQELLDNIKIKLLDGSLKMVGVLTHEQFESETYKV